MAIPGSNPLVPYDFVEWVGSDYVYNSSTGHKLGYHGYRPPGYTTAQRDAIPVGELVSGQMIWNTDTEQPNFYTSLGWKASVLT